MVTAVNFDYRGFDTLGEEFMLLCAVTGTVVLLRGNRGEQRAAHPGQIPGPPSRRERRCPADRRLLGPLILLFGTLRGAARDGDARRRLSRRGDHRVGALLLWLGEGYRGGGG